MPSGMELHRRDLLRAVSAGQLPAGLGLSGRGVQVCRHHRAVMPPLSVKPCTLPSVLQKESDIPKTTSSWSGPCVASRVSVDG